MTIRIPKIYPYQRMYWDCLVMLCVVLCAFDIPFGYLVGYPEPAANSSFNVERALDILFLIVFGGDLLLNCITVSYENRNGLWGWRALGRLFGKDWSVTSSQSRSGKQQLLLVDQPEIAKNYICSGWFPIDLVATIPWAILLGGGTSALGLTRTARLLRLSQLFRLLRLTKGFNALNRLRLASGSFPALGRMLVTFLFLPWLAHFFACLLVYTEREIDGTLITGYIPALESVFMTFLTGSAEMELLSPPGHTIVLLGVVLSVIFIGTMIANLSALFTSMDREKSVKSKINRSDHFILLGWPGGGCKLLEQLFAEQSSNFEVLIVTDKDPDNVWAEIGQSSSSIPGGAVDIVNRPKSDEAFFSSLSPSRAQGVIVSAEASTLGASKKNVHTQTVILKDIIACVEAMKKSRSLEDKNKEHRLPVIVATDCPESANLLQKGIPPRAEKYVQLNVIDTSMIPARVFTQVVLEPRMCDVYKDLFSFELDGESGAEFYIHAASDQQIGVHFSNIYAQYKSAIPVGVIRSGDAILLPKCTPAEPEFLLVEGDKLVLLANSDPKPSKSIGAIDSTPVLSHEFSRTQLDRRCVLVAGAGPLAENLSENLSTFLPKGSEVVCFSQTRPQSPSEAEITLIEEVRHEGDLMDLPNSINAIPLQDLTKCDTVVFVPPNDEKISHDDQVLLGLAALYSRWPKNQESPLCIVDLHSTKNEGAVNAYSDPIVADSNNLTSSYLVQVSREPERSDVFQQLIATSEGAEVYIRSILDYLEPGEEAVAFIDLQHRATVKDEIALGFLHADGPLVLATDDRHSPLRVNSLTHLVVLAED
jgi:hypothetical protein